MDITGKSVTIHAAQQRFRPIHGRITSEDDIAVTVVYDYDGSRVTSIIPWREIGKIEMREQVTA